MHPPLFVADIQAGASFARYHIACPWKCFHLTHSCHQTRRIAGFTLDNQNPLRYGTYCVVPQMHRRRARMICPPAKEYACLRLAGNGLHDGKRQTEFIEHRPLFDVELKVTQNWLP